MKISEMDYVIDELKAEIKKRDLTIHALTKTKNELELRLSESRSRHSLKNRNNLSISSVQRFNISLSRTTNSNSEDAVNCPNTLAVPSADIKPRDKDNEKVALSEQIERMKANCEMLRKYICQLIARYADTLDICNENLLVANEADFIHTFMIFENCFEKMIESYTLSSRELKAVKEELNEVRVQKEKVAKQNSDLNGQLKMCRKQLDSIKNKRSILEQQNQFCQKQLEKYQDEMKRLDQEREDTQFKLSKLDGEHITTIQTYNERLNQLTTENMKIKSQFSSLLQELERLGPAKSKGDVDSTNHEQKIIQTLNELNEKSSQMHQLEEVNGNLLNTVAAHVQLIRQNKEAIAKLENKLQAVNEEKNILLEEIDVTRLNVCNIQNDFEKQKVNYENQLQNTNGLGDEIVRLNEVSTQMEVQLQDKINTSDGLEAKLADANKTIFELNKKIADMIQSRDQLGDYLHNLKADLSLTRAELTERNLTLAKLENDYLNYRTEKDNELHNMKRDINTKTTNYEHTIEDLNKKIESLVEDKSLLEADMRDKGRKIKSLNKNLENLKTQKAEIEQQFANEKQELQQTNHQLTMKAAQVEMEILSILKCSFDEGCPNDVPNLDLTEFEDPMASLKKRIATIAATNIELMKSEKELQMVISDLKEQIAELQTSENNLNSINKNLAENITKFESKIEILETKKAHLTSTVTELNGDLTVSQESPQGHDQQIADYKTQINQLNERVGKLVSEKNVLLNNISTLQTKEFSLLDNAEKLQQEINSRTKSETNLKETIFVSNKHLTKLREEEMKLQKLVKKKDDELKKRLQATSEDHDKIKSLQKENIELLDQINTLNNNLAGMKVLEMELKLSIEQQESMRKDLQDKETSLQVAVEEIGHLNESLATLKACQKSLEEVAVDRQIKISELEETIVIRDVSIKRLEENLLEKDANCVALQVYITDLEESIADKDFVVEECQQTLDAANAENNNLREERLQTTNNFQDQIDSLEKDKTALGKANKSLHDNLMETEKSLKRTEAINVKLLLEIDELKAGNLAATLHEAEYANLQVKYAAICAENERLIVSKRQFEDNCSKLNKRLEKMSTKLTKLQSNAAKLEKSNSDGRCEIETLQKRFQQNNLKNQDLQNKLTLSKTELMTTNDKLSSLQELHDAEISRNIALTNQLKVLRVQISDEFPSAQTDLKIVSEKAANLQKLYNEEIAKTTALNNELLQVRIQLESKQLELEDKRSFLDEVKSDLENKLLTITKLSVELGEVKSKNERLQEKNNFFTEKLQLYALVEAKLEQTDTTARTLQYENSSLRTRLDDLANSEENRKETTSHIDNIKHELELKVERLSTTLEKMRASLESAHIENGALQKENSELKFNLDSLCGMMTIVISTTQREEEDTQFRNEDQDFQAKYHYIAQSVKQLNAAKQNVEDHCVQLASQLEASHKENLQLGDNFSKVCSELQALEKQKVQHLKEIMDLQRACDRLRADNENLTIDQSENLRVLQECEGRQNEMLHQHIISENSLKEQLEKYESELEDKNATIGQLECELTESENVENIRLQEFLSQTDELQELRQQFKVLNQQLGKERERNGTLKKDVTIFQAKLIKNRQITEEKEKQWEDERNNLTNQIKMADDRVENIRLELEAKLENMKNVVKKFEKTDQHATSIGKSHQTSQIPTLSYSGLRTDAIGTMKHSHRWRKRWPSILKYPFAIAIFNLFLAIFIRYAITRNNLEIVLRKTVSLIF